MQTTSEKFSCDKFDEARDKEVVKGVYTCRSGEKDPGRLGSNQGSDGKKKKGAASSTFGTTMPTYGFLGLIALLFML